jgi:hypothetical protein
MQKMDRCIILNQKYIMSQQPNILLKSQALKLPQMRKILRTIMERMGIVVMGKTKQVAKRVEEELIVARENKQNKMPQL